MLQIVVIIDGRIVCHVPGFMAIMKDTEFWVDENYDKHFEPTDPSLQLLLHLSGPLFSLRYTHAGEGRRE